MYYRSSGLVTSKALSGFIQAKTAEGLSPNTLGGYECILKKGIPAPKFVFFPFYIRGTPRLAFFSAFDACGLERMRMQNCPSTQASDFAWVFSIRP